MTDDEVEDFVENNNIQHYYGGPGRFFQQKPIVRHSKRRTLIIAISGFDV